MEKGGKWRGRKGGKQNEGRDIRVEGTRRNKENKS